VLGLMALTLVGCSDLDTNPAGSDLTKEQVDEVIAEDASKLKSEVSGLYANMIQEGAIRDWYGSVRHYDFGYAAVMMMTDQSGQDEVSENSGYNWFRKSLSYQDRTVSDEVGYYLWNHFYNNIRTSNSIISSISLDEASDVAKGYVGQAYGMRAFCYLNLIQMFQFTYKGHEDAAGVPIVTEATTAEMTKENPRAAVKDVYALIMSDLDKAISCLEKYTRGGKNEIDLNVAYGLRARANLLMQNWSAAYADAVKAAEGFTPLSIEEAGAPGFNDINANNWIWGCDVSETNDIVQSGIVNFPSMMCSFTGNGYSPMYASRSINSNLWKEIPTTDVRKGWWFDEKLSTPIVDPKRVVYVKDEKNGDYVMVLNSSGEEVADIQTPYINAKFGAYKNDYGNETNACDIPMMRVEEMILIQAEAKAMSGDVEGGKKILEDFVKTYRDPSYSCSASSAEEVQNAVWFQRRIELWGEGFSFLDLLRLKKPLDRTGANYDKAVTFKLPAESGYFLWIIPESETNYNKACKNNEILGAPQPQ